MDQFSSVRKGLKHHFQGKYFILADGTLAEMEVLTPPIPVPQMDKTLDKM
jgi:hypothetical protein